MFKTFHNKSELLDTILVQQQSSSEVLRIVEKIISSVRDCGDEALIEYTQKFDHILLDSIKVDAPSIELENIALKNAIIQASKNIRVFHQKQMPKVFDHQQEDGTEVSFKWRPIKKVGVYVPGGNYPLMSTVLMNVIPAQVAGVDQIIVCTPPQTNGDIDPNILSVCQNLGIKDIFQVGGAQAIAAMTYGTETIPKVNKIVGPGNRYVAAAKQYVSNCVGIDMVAGPTELVIIVDESANPTFIAADLISQAEHDQDAFTLLLSTEKNIIEKTQSEINRLLKSLNTKATATESFLNNGFAFLANSIDECIEISNHIAPEHLSIQTKNVETLHNECIAGAIFLGQETPVAWGDYWAGPNHTLPTSGAAHYRGLLNVLDFLVPFSVTKGSVNQKSIQAISFLAEAEGLTGHALSTRLREGYVLC